MPVPKAADLAELNRRLFDGCRRDEHRRIAGHPDQVGVAMIKERESLLAAVEHGFALSELSPR